MPTEAARFNSDIKKMVDAKQKVGIIIACIAEQPRKFESSTGNYEIWNVYEICEAVGMSPRFFRRIFKNRYKKANGRAFVEFNKSEIEAATDALKAAKKAVSEYRSDSEAQIFSIVVSSIIGSSTNQSFYGLE